MDRARVSVVLPAYNRAALTVRAIESVLSQEGADLELIVVDDGSTDDTAARVAGLGDPRVRLIRLEENGGASAARNRGLEAAAAPLVAFIDSDDRWHPRKLERQVAALEGASDSAVLCVCSREYGSAAAPFRVQYKDEELDGDAARARIAAGMGLSTSCWLVRRGAVEAAGGFDEALPRMQDYELSLRVAQHGHVVLMQEVLVAGEVLPDSLSASAERYARAIDIIIERHRDLFARHPAGHSHMVFRAGKYLAIEGRCREALGWFRRALRIRPANARALAGLVLCATGLFPLLRRLKYRRPARVDRSLPNSGGG